MTEEKNVQQEIPLKLIHMNEIQATDTHWLWYPYIPYGKAEECGISKRTMDAAKKALGVQSEKTSDGWFWSLPDDKDARLQECKDKENLQPCIVEQEGV